MWLKYKPSAPEARRIANQLCAEARLPRDPKRREFMGRRCAPPRRSGRTPFWAATRRLRRQIQRAFIVKGRHLTTREIADYCYRRPHRNWHKYNIRRAMADWGLEPVGRLGARVLVWYWQPKSDSIS
jgi:hypothetical protein